MGANLPKPPAQFGQVADKGDEVLALFAEILPADPADVVVLAIGVVVASLAVADLVAGQDQRRTLRQQQTRKLISSQLTSQRNDIGIVGRPLMAAIVAVIVAGAVAIAFAIGLIVLLVVAEQVGERKTVMDGDVVDTGTRRAAVMVEQIGGGGHAARHFTDQAAFAAPVASHRRTVAIIPLRPLRGKRADLIAAEPEVPGLGDEFYRRQHRVLSHRGQEGGIAIEAVRLARQRGREVEAEAVDVAHLNPVAQRIHDHLQHARMG